MKRIVYFLLCFYMLLSCTGNREFKDALIRARNMMAEHPDSSLIILDTLGRHSDDFGDHFRMQYLLTLTYAQAKTGKTFKSDSITKLLVRYFDGHGTRSEKSLACYMNGCALSDLGQAPEALQAFYDVIDKEDTTQADCDYHVLRGIYGQMATIFHRQNLPQDEIWAMKHYIEYVRKTSSEADYLIAKGQMVRPYYLLNEKDSILAIINEVNQSLSKLRKSKLAASFLATSTYIYMERGQISEAKKVMDIYEKESGLFDRFGQLGQPSGRWLLFCCEITMEIMNQQKNSQSGKKIV